MARLFTSGGEIRDHPTTDIGSPDGFAAGAAMCVTDTTTFRSGTASIKCPGTATNNSYRVFPFVAPALAQSVFPRVYFWLSALPNATKKIAALVTSADGALVSARLTSAGKLQLWNDAAVTQIGADSELVVEANRWYRIQLRLKVATGAADEAELLAKVDDYQAIDESISGAALTISDTHAARFWAGWVEAPGVTSDMFIDDLAGNDSTGTTKQVSWPGEGGVVAMSVVRQITGGSWTDCSGSTTNVHQGANKLPPVGQADHTTAGHTGANAHQARIAANTSQTLIMRSGWAQTAGVTMDLVITPGSIDSTNTQNIGSATGNQRRAQSFIFGGPVTVDSVAVHLHKVGSPTDDLIIEIQSDSGGNPSGTVLATVATIVASTLTTTATKYTFSLGSALPLNAGTYWIVMRRTGAVSLSHYCRWAKWLGGAYDGGPAVYDGTNWLKSGTQWGADSHFFGIYLSSGTRTVTLAVPYLCHGQGTSGAKAGSIETVNFFGTSGASKTFNFGDNVGVAGNYPTNWRWAQADPIFPTTVPTRTPDNAFNINKVSGTGSSNPCLICGAHFMVEYLRPSQGWSRWQKTADSTFWWANRADTSTLYECGPEGETPVTVPGGDWAIYPEPQVTEGTNFPTTLTSVTDATLQAGYVLA